MIYRCVIVKMMSVSGEPLYWLRNFPLIDSLGIHCTFFKVVFTNSPKANKQAQEKLQFYSKWGETRMVTYTYRYSSGHLWVLLNLYLYGSWRLGVSCPAKNIIPNLA